MADKGNDTFHDMIAKAASEYDRICAENALLRYDLQGAAMASPPPSTVIVEEGVCDGVDRALPNGATKASWNQACDCPVVSPREGPFAHTRDGLVDSSPVGSASVASAAAALTEDVWPSCRSDRRGLPVRTPSVPKILTVHQPHSDPSAADMTRPQVVVPETLETSLLPAWYTEMEAPRTPGSFLLPVRQMENNGLMGMRPRSIHDRIEEVAASQARLDAYLRQTIPALSSVLSRSQRPATNKSKSKYAGVAPVLPEITEPSGRFKVERQLTSENVREKSRSTRPSLAKLSSGMRRFLEESKDWDVMVSLRRVVHSNAFTTFFALMVVAHALFIGYETDWVASNLRQHSETLDAIHVSFNLAFLFELIVRMLVECDQFFTGPEWKWNCLDFGVVVLSGIDFFVVRSFVQLSQSGGIRSLRFARILRLMRTVRILHTIKSVHELQKMLYAVLSSMRTLSCSSCILAFIVYFFSILFTSASAEQRMLDQDDTDLLGQYYGTLGRSCKSLFWAVSDGISWSMVYEPVADIHWTYGFLFFTYIIIITFGVMNVVTSIFVESAFLSAQHYREVIVKDKEHSKAITVGHMKAVFMQMDADGSGEISSDEMEYFLWDPELRKYFEALDLSADDTRMIFRLLDADGSGVIDMEEFCDGCLKLRGEAKSTDMHILIFQLNRFLKKWSAFTEYVESKFAAMERALSSRGLAVEPQGKVEL